MSSYRIPKDLLLQCVADETVILDPGSGNYFILDAIGTRMIALFRETNSIETTAQKMVENYQASHATIQADLIELLEKMVSQGLAQRD